MTHLFFTADEHYGHAPRKDTGVGGVLKLCKRPFASLDEMKETIIDHHNRKVPNNKGNMTVHVGDWFWHTLPLGEALEIIDRLNGGHAFMFGNHDKLIAKHKSIFAEKLDFIWGENQAGGAKIFHFNNRNLTVDHFARRVWEGSHRGHWHVYGHSHTGLPSLGKSMDIGVDGNNFYPWAIEEIAFQLENLPQHHTIDNTGTQGEDVDNVREGQAAVAQLAEHRTCNAGVGGSSPSGGSKISRFDVDMFEQVRNGG